MTTDTADKADIAASHAQDVAASAQDRAGEVTAHAQDAAHQVAGTAAEQAQHVKAEAVRQVRDLAGEATSQLSAQAQEQTQRLTVTLRQLAEELTGMAQAGHPGGTATELVHQGSDRVHSLASYLDGKQPTEILDDARAFARRRPGAFLAGAAVLGLLAGRVGRGVKDASPDDNATSSSNLTVEGAAVTPPHLPASPGDPTPALGFDEHPADGLTSSAGFTSSTTHFTRQDPLTGALLPEETLGGQPLSDRGGF